MTETESRKQRRFRGIVLILLGGLCLSSGGVIIRSVDHVDPWAILFYRAVGLVALLILFSIWRHRRGTVAAFRSIGWEGGVMALGLGFGFTCYVFGMLMTTIANVSFIISAGPLFAALLGWVILGERVRTSTWLVIAGAATGMGLMFAEGLSLGGMAGNVVALGLPFTFGIMLVMIRRVGDRDMVPATCLGGVIAGIIGFVASDNLSVTVEDLAILLWLGVGQLGAGFLLLTLGAKYLPAAETALLALTESVLAPIWAWLFIAEVPGPLSLIGGLIVLGCVVIEAWKALREVPATDTT
ncbi:MAG: DMT family transporter [Rhodospirillales bacterium]